jgi:outer membrane lipoprotein-sorting protein
LLPRDAPALLAQVRAAWPQVSAYVADAAIEVFSPAGRVRTHATLAVAAPASFRIDVRGPHGGVVQSTATDGERLSVLYVLESVFVTGDATPENLDLALALAPLRWEPSRWSALLRGQLAIDDDARWGQDGEHLTLHGPGGLSVGIAPQTHQVVWIEGQGARIALAERGNEGLPRRITLAAAGTEAVIELRDVEVKAALPPSIFAIAAPAGTAVREF